MILADLDLAKRLEPAEGHACVSFADARRRVRPECKSEWIECGGGYAVFDGPDSPVTQCFALGIFEELTPPVLDRVEAFFRERSAPVWIELCPLAGVPAVDLLVSRNYHPVEISSVLYRTVESPGATSTPQAPTPWARPIEPHEVDLWSQVSANGWAHEMPELKQFLVDLGGIIANRSDSTCFLAGCGETAGAAGVLSLHGSVALFGGSATIPEMRPKGLQAALLQARMRYAHEHGCDIAMMVAMAGSGSQRNAERQGFRIAYTRTKWQLRLP